MATTIDQIEDIESGRTVLRVSGDMFRDDAVLLERIAVSLGDEKRAPVVIDLADLDFLDSEAAPVLKALADRQGFTIEGVEIFLQSTIDQAERQDTAT